MPKLSIAQSRVLERMRKGATLTCNSFTGAVYLAASRRIDYRTFEGLLTGQHIKAEKSEGGRTHYSPAVTSP